MQSEQLRQRRRERKRLERERNKKAAQMCAGDELDFLVPRRVAALFGRTMRVGRENAGVARRRRGADGDALRR
jgi:hypothetical protein